MHLDASQSLQQKYVIYIYTYTHEISNKIYEFHHPPGRFRQKQYKREMGLKNS